MKISEIKKRVAMVINAYSERGVVTESTNDNVEDFYNKMNAYIDIAQKDIAEQKHIRKTFKVSHIFPIPFFPNSFETIEHTDTDITYSLSNANAYHFCVDGEADVYIEGITSDGETELITSVYGYSDNGGFNRFKGLIETNEEYESIQIRFSGDYYYNIRDVFLIPVPYKHYVNIPDFGRYIEYDMPDDFLKALTVKIRKASNYTPISDYYWDKNNILAVSAYESGEIKVEYAARPTTIDSDTEDTYELEIIESAQSALVDYVASMLMQKEDYSQSLLLMQNYNQKMLNINEVKGSTQIKVKKVY